MSALGAGFSAEAGGLEPANAAPEDAAAPLAGFPIPPGLWPAVQLPEGARVCRDIAYARTPQKRLLLNLFLPGEADGPLPVIVWFHGGGWQGGARDDLCPFHQVGRGYAVASVMYRFSQEALFPAQIHDCKGAIRWLRAHAAEYGLDAERIGVWGISAGGHLSALLGTSGDVRELEGEVGGNLEFSSRVQAVCDCCGPTDLFQLDTPERREAYALALGCYYALVGGPLAEHRELATLASATAHVRGGEPPFLLVHGEADNLLPLMQSEALYEALRNAGDDAMLHVAPGGGHIFWGEDVDRTVNAFFDKHLKTR